MAFGNRDLNHLGGDPTAPSNKRLTLHEAAAVKFSMKRVAPSLGDVHEPRITNVGLAAGAERDPIFFAGFAVAPPVVGRVHDRIQSFS
jgi:hypothetical protein